jgi:hypothetical protein
MTGPKQALHIVQSRASSFKWEYPLLSLKGHPVASYVFFLVFLSLLSLPLSFSTYRSNWMTQNRNVKYTGNKVSCARIWKLWNIKTLYRSHVGTAVAQWLRCCATNRKVAGSIPADVIGLFQWRNPSDRTIALGSTQPLTEMSTRSISWG